MCLYLSVCLPFYLSIYPSIFPPERKPKHGRQELNNGRIAMFAIIGQIVAELQTGLFCQS